MCTIPFNLAARIREGKQQEGIEHGKNTATGTNKKHPVWQVIIGAALIVFGCGLLFSGCGSTSSDSSNDNSAQQVEQAENGEETKVDDSEEKADYTIKKEKAGETSYSTFQIKGTLTNNTDSKWSYVSVTYTLYDKDGDQIGTALDNLNGLKPGKSWKFEANSLEASFDEVDSYELDDVTYY